ncbi:hypothetical protein IGI04_035380 [Brassica rapa subsp. trilocularis]|uniref:Uncharacterized protein n=1 Tax=Brassica rapa subsp. trilocularis TaxID=1813537 RepID=A0ABQ7LBE8_BRACM|nr:hypothetical protein IGI04_035380 [Brassica rapa subsp. trilocularis]
MAGQSSQVAVDGTNLSGLQTDPAAANAEDVLPTDQANLTGTQQDGQEHQESDEEVEFSNANRDGGQREKVADGTANVTATLSKEDLLEAMKDIKASVPWSRKKVKDIRKLRLNLIQAKRQLGRVKTVTGRSGRVARPASMKLGSVHSSSVPTKSAPLAGLLAHSAEAAESQLISARRTVRTLGRWSGSGSVAGCEKKRREKEREKERVRPRERPIVVVLCSGDSDRLRTNSGQEWEIKTRRRAWRTLTWFTRLGPILMDQPMACLVKTRSRPKAGSGKGVRWAIEPDSIGRSHLDSIRLDGLVFGDDPDLFVCSVYLFWTIYLILSQGVELRMVLVKPRSREGSVSERLCNGWLDDTRDELVIVYETVKKLCIESHVSK